MDSKLGHKLNRLLSNRKCSALGLRFKPVFSVKRRKSVLNHNDGSHVAKGRKTPQMLPICNVAFSRLNKLESRFEQADKRHRQSITSMRQRAISLTEANSNHGQADRGLISFVRNRAAARDRFLLLGSGPNQLDVKDVIQVPCNNPRFSNDKNACLQKMLRYLRNDDDKRDSLFKEDLNMSLARYPLSVRLKMAELIYQRFRETVFEANVDTAGLLPALNDDISAYRKIFPDDDSFQEYVNARFKDDDKAPKKAMNIKFSRTIPKTSTSHIIATTEIREFTTFVTTNGSSSFWSRLWKPFTKTEMVFRLPETIVINSLHVDDYSRLKIAVAHEMCHVAEILAFQRYISRKVLKNPIFNRTETYQQLLENFRVIADKANFHSWLFRQHGDLFATATSDEHVRVTYRMPIRPRYMMLLGYPRSKTGRKPGTLKTRLYILRHHRFAGWAFSHAKYRRNQGLLPFRKLTYLHNGRRKSNGMHILYKSI